MTARVSRRGVSRRTLLKAAAATGALQIAGPFVIAARGAETVKIGLDNPLTGTYAAVGKSVSWTRGRSRAEVENRSGSPSSAAAISCQVNPSSLPASRQRAEAAVGSVGRSRR